MARLGHLALLFILLTPLDVRAAPEGGAAAEAPLMRLVQRPQDQALILTLTLNRTSIGENFIVYQDKKRLLVPLGGVMSALEIAITTDPDTGTASGFFINENRRFSLDLTTGTASLNGRTFVLEPGSVERQLTDIYVDATLLAHWFSIRYHLLSEDLTLIVFSVELLPIQERLDRERRPAGVRRPPEFGPHTILEPPPNWIGWPVVHPKTPDS